MFRAQSTYTNQPSWQTSAVNAYFAQSPAVPPSSMFNKAHRAFPDVAANGHNCKGATIDNLCCVPYVFFFVQMLWCKTGRCCRLTERLARVP